VRRLGAVPLWLVGWWALSRAIVLACAAIVHVVGPRGWLRLDEHVHVLGVLGAWDGRWYRMVAADGYLLVPGRQSDPAFFPLFPLLLRAVHASGLGYIASGIVLSNLALLAALVAFHALTRELLDEALAKRATIVAAVFPLGYAFSMGYPESVVFAAICVAGLAAMRGHWAVAIVAAAAAALARPEGLFLALPLAAAAWSQRASLTPARRGLAAAAVFAPVAALASYPLYLDSVLNDPLAWSRAEHAWGRRFALSGPAHAVTHLPQALDRTPWDIRDVAALLVYLLLLLAARRAGASWAWLLAALPIIVLPVFSGSFESIGRFGLLAPPIYWGLARWASHDRRRDVAVRVACIVLLAAATVTIPFTFP
jgi:hypothetical protein